MECWWHWIPSSFQFLVAERQRGCRNLLKDYFVSVSKHLVKVHKDIQAAERQNHKILHVSFACPSAASGNHPLTKKCANFYNGNLRIFFHKPRRNPTSIWNMIPFSKGPFLTCELTRTSLQYGHRWLPGWGRLVVPLWHIEHRSGCHLYPWIYVWSKTEKPLPALNGNCNFI